MNRIISPRVDTRRLHLLVKAQLAIRAIKKEIPVARVMMISFVPLCLRILMKEKMEKPSMTKALPITITEKKMMTMKFTQPEPVEPQLATLLDQEVTVAQPVTSVFLLVSSLTVKDRLTLRREKASSISTEDVQ